MHAHGAALMCQITHLGRRGEPYADELVADDRARRRCARRCTAAFPKEMDEHDIDRVVQAYGAAARRCQEGGLDGIETLAGGHLIGQFLSPDTNRRTDRFGGSLRKPLPLRAHGLRGDPPARRRPISWSASATSSTRATAGGLSSTNASTSPSIFERAGPLDFFNAIYGRMDTEIGARRHNMPGMASPIAPWLAPVGAFKREVGCRCSTPRASPTSPPRATPSARACSTWSAMTRAHIADPHIVTKLEAGAGGAHPALRRRHPLPVAVPPACLHNPSTGRETRCRSRSRARRAPGRKVVVVGGGPAGLEAARVAAERGQGRAVRGGDRLGGQVLLAARASWRKDLIGIVDWRRAGARAARRRRPLNTYAGAGRCAAPKRPDVGDRRHRRHAGHRLDRGAEHCTSAWDAIGGTGRSARKLSSTTAPAGIRRRRRRSWRRRQGRAGLARLDRRRSSRRS